LARLPNEVNFLIDKLYDDNIKTVSNINQLDRSYLGTLILFGYYDPKTKDQLPYWDMIPLLLLFGFSGTYMWGLNIHYIPYTYRVKFVGELYKKRFLENKILQWADIKRAWFDADIPSAYAYFSYRRYLINRISTNIKAFGEQDWKPVVVNVLPEFKKLSASAIYALIYHAITRKRKQQGLKKPTKRTRGL